MSNGQVLLPTLTPSTASALASKYSGQMYKGALVLPALLQLHKRLGFVFYFFASSSMGEDYPIFTRLWREVTHNLSFFQPDKLLLTLQGPFKCFLLPESHLWTPEALGPLQCCPITRIVICFVVELVVNMLVSFLRWGRTVRK